MGQVGRRGWYWGGGVGAVGLSRWGGGRAVVVRVSGGNETPRSVSRPPGPLDCGAGHGRDTEERPAPPIQPPALDTFVFLGICVENVVFSIHVSISGVFRYNGRGRCSGHSAARAFPGVRGEACAPPELLTQDLPPLCPLPLLPSPSLHPITAFPSPYPPAGPLVLLSPSLLVTPARA